MSYFDEYDQDIEYIRVTGEIVRETSAAVLFRPVGDNREIWIPKSQIENHFDTDDGKDTFEIPEWLAEREGL